MAERESETLDRVVDEILRGERIVPFPPGTLAFVFATLTLLVGAALSLAATLPHLIAQYVPHPAAAQLSAVAAVAVIVSTAASVAAIGVAPGYRVARNVTHAFLVLAVLAAIFGLVRGAAAVHVVALAFLGVSAWLVNGVAYRTFASFKRRLHERRVEMVAQMRARN